MHHTVSIINVKLEHIIIIFCSLCDDGMNEREQRHGMVAIRKERGKNKERKYDCMEVSLNEWEMSELVSEGSKKRKFM
jgi:hypothetical protein